MRDAHGIATAELLAAAEAWGENVERVRTGGLPNDVLRLRAKLCDAATAYSKAQRALDALKPAPALSPSDGVRPPGVDDGAGADPVSYRRRDDGGFVPVVGAFFCLAVAVALFASCLWVLAWCPSCETSSGGIFAGAWPSEGGDVHFETQPDGSVLACRPILYVHNGYVTTTGAMKCGLAHVELSVEAPRGLQP